MCMEKNKKAFYAVYGIEYSNGKIRAPYGEMIPELLTVGTNGKVGDAATFSILPGTGAIDSRTCGEKTRAIMEKAGVRGVTGTCTHDCAGCYAKAGRYNMDGVKSALVLRTIIAYKYPDFLRRAITAQIIASDIKQVRIHAAGDFFGKEYIAAWKSIAETCGRDNGCIFWTYTKEYAALKAFENVKNVFITPSLTPYGVNYGTCAELLSKHAALTRAGYNVHICACGTPHEKHCAECMTGCKRVGRGVDYVLFIQHSTPGYKAGKNDPVEYAAVCDIIAKQGN